MRNFIFPSTPTLVKQEDITTIFTIPMKIFLAS